MTWKSSTLDDTEGHLQPIWSAILTTALFHVKFDMHVYTGSVQTKLLSNTESDTKEYL